MNVLRASPLHIQLHLLHDDVWLIEEWPYLFRNLDGAVSEGDALAEALGAAGHGAVPGDADVLSMNLVEQHWWQVVGARLAARVPRGCNRTSSLERCIGTFIYRYICHYILLSSLPSSNLL